MNPVLASFYVTDRAGAKQAIKDGKGLSTDDRLRIWLNVSQHLYYEQIGELKKRCPKLAELVYQIADDLCIRGLGYGTIWVDYQEVLNSIPYLESKHKKTIRASIAKQRYRGAFI